MSNESNWEAADLGNFLLKAGAALIKAGAGSNRVVINIMRFAAAYGFEAQVNPGTRYISVSLFTEQQEAVFSGSRSMPALPGVNFKVITAISQLSWDLTKRKLSLTDADSELDHAIQKPEYHRVIILLLVGLAGAAFCFTFGGTSIEMGIAFMATVAGLFLRQELNRRKFNSYIVTYVSAVFASLIIGVFWKAGIESRLDHAFATAILFLIPGVPLINSFIDLMDGYIMNGIDRGINGLMHSFAIAAGLATVLYIFKFQ
jgi:uncharacterized membrane protein YjjP (DUF1212 family)